jgi:large subunit ribosomal protein L35
MAVPRKQKEGKYKMKTHKATAHRFGITGSGIIVRTKGGKAHLRRKRSHRVRALFGEMIPVKGRNLIKRIRRLAPYMKP